LEEWTAAELICEASGGYLATIADASENAFVLSIVGGSIGNLWLGGDDITFEVTFVRAIFVFVVFLG